MTWLLAVSKHTTRHTSIAREMLGNADSIFSPKFDKKTDQSEDTE